MANVTIDNSGNLFPGTTTIADIARFTFDRIDSDETNIYFVDGIFDAEWRHEIETKEYEYTLGVDVTFKDGSKLHVGAYGEIDCYDQGRAERASYDAGLRYVRPALA